MLRESGLSIENRVQFTIDVEVVQDRDREVVGADNVHWLMLGPTNPISELNGVHSGGRKR